MKPSVNNINCGRCKNNCCGAIPNLVPVLLPEEEDMFTLKEKHETSYSPIWTLKKKEDNSCIYYDNDSHRCGIYTNRPLECRIYPFLLDFQDGIAGIALDMRYCEGSKYAIKPNVNLKGLPKDWIKAYISLSPKFNGKK